MIRSFGVRTAVIVSVIAGAILFGLPRATGAPGPKIAAHHFGTDASAVRSYWSRARMRAAAPLRLEASQLVSGQPTSSSETDTGPLRIEPIPPTADRTELSGPSTAGAVTSPSAAPFTRTEVADPSASPYRTAGRLFGVSADGSKYDCSATSVTGQNESVVWTAAHCVYHARSGGWSRRIEFVPGYHQGAAPYGEWPVVAARLSPQWIQAKSPMYDMAALVVGPNPAGQTLMDVVGGRGFLAGQATQQSFDVYGYPSSRPFDGERQHVCRSSYLGDDPLHANTMAIGCDMTEGSSGGGWIIDDRYLNSVSSYGYDSRPGLLYGPHFGDTAAELHQSASTMPVPREWSPPNTQVGGVQHHRMRLSLRLVAGRASGKMTAPDGYRACTRGARITVLHEGNGDWDVVGRTRTGDSGRYRVRIPSVAGAYKAFSPSGSVDDLNRCTEATSSRRNR